LLIEPVGLIHGPAAAQAVAAGLALPLAGGPSAFTLARLADGALVPVSAVPPAAQAALGTLTRPPHAWAGLPARPCVMGILNVTPDSFSNLEAHRDAEAAIAAGRAMARAGADLIDVGGESTRPGSVAVDPETERTRVVPVIRGLAEAGLVVSVDTRHASTMQAAVEAGARIVNDVSALAYDPQAPATVARLGCPVVLMHMRGTPQTMGSLATYADVAGEVAQELAGRLTAATEAGIAREQIALDPGIGFAKHGPDNVALLQRLGLLLGFGCPLLVGVSRKRFIGTLSGEAEPARRAPGSIAAGLHALLHGARILRVHDVAETVQAVRAWQGLMA
jgi:dihydropteroate synthase